MPEFEDHVEIEWQFDVEDLGPVEKWLRDLPPSLPFAIAATDPDEHLDTYFDTSDWRIYRSGYSLRSRRSQNHVELTLKSIDGIRDGYVRRREVTQQVADDETESVDQIRGPVGDRIRAIRGRSSVSPLFTAVTRRKRFRLWFEGRDIGELSLDNTTFIGEAFEDQSQLMRVEVETTADQTSHLDQFVDAMSDACDLVPATVSKFETGVSIFGIHSPEAINVGSIEFDRDSSIRELATAVLRRHFGELLRREPGTRLGDDVEELHDMRVAARRLRAALSLFRPYLRPEYDEIGEDLRWVASALGEVRDLDVQLAEIQAWKVRLDPHDADALEPLITELNRRRDAARGSMLTALDAERYEKFVGEFSGLLTSPIEPDESGRAVDIAPDLVLRRCRRFRRRADRLRESSDDADFHRLRIDGKRLRYSLEFVSPLYAKIVRQAIAQLVEVQDLLGRHQDSIVAIVHLREIVADPNVGLPPLTIFAMGRVAERYDLSAQDARDRFPKAYKRMTHKQLRRLERELKRRSRRRPPKAAKLGVKADIVPSQDPPPLKISEIESDQ